MNLTPESIIKRFDDYPRNSLQIRGDHDLNSGLPITKNLISAAVLIGLIKYPGKLAVLLTQRTSHLQHHPGQISFPGGQSNPNDKSPEETALRETEEEVGLHRRYIKPIGRLCEYVTRTGFSITPVVAFIEPTFSITHDPFEVEEVFEVPLDFLLNPANHKRHRRKFGKQTREFHAMPFEGHYIWGATAGILINLYEFLIIK